MIDLGRIGVTDWSAMVPEQREEHQYLATSPQGVTVLCWVQVFSVLSLCLLLPCCVPELAMSPCL